MLNVLSVRTVVVAVLCGLVLLPAWFGPVQAREPFFTPPPPMEAYDYPGAADSLALRGLLRTEGASRAVVYIASLREYRVLRPGDRLEVMWKGLRHEFRAESMGDRRLLLRGGDGNRYETGVAYRE